MNAPLTSAASVAELVKSARGGLNLTQEEFGRKVRVVGSTVSEWERGKSFPTTRNLHHLEALLLQNQEKLGYTPGLTKALIIKETAEARSQSTDIQEQEVVDDRPEIGDERQGVPAPIDEATIAAKQTAEIADEGSSTEAVTPEADSPPELEQVSNPKRKRRWLMPIVLGVSLLSLLLWWGTYNLLVVKPAKASGINERVLVTDILGLVDVNKACQTQHPAPFNGPAVLIPPRSATSWKCSKLWQLNARGHDDGGIDMGRACREQYGEGTEAQALYKDKPDWVCLKPKTGSAG